MAMDFDILVLCDESTKETAETVAFCLRDDLPESEVELAFESVSAQFLLENWQRDHNEHTLDAIVDVRRGSTQTDDLCQTLSKLGGNIVVVHVVREDDEAAKAHWAHFHTEGQTKHSHPFVQIVRPAGVVVWVAELVNNLVRHLTSDEINAQMDKMRMP